MAFYEDMYYSLPENERETFINSLSEEDRQSLMLSLKKNDLYSNVSNNQEERFESIYKELKDDEIREAFINIFNYLDENKKEIFLDLFFEKIIKCELEYYDSIVFLIKDILTKYKNKLNKFIDSRYFRRILRFNIDIKTLEILREAADFNINTVYNSHIDNIDSFKLKYNYTNKNNEKLLNMIYKVPEEKRIYFFEEFEKNEEFKDTEFIKMLRVVLDMDKYSFLYVFKNKNYEIYDGIQIDIMTSYIVYIYPYYNNIISHLYSNFKSEAEKVVFSRILNSVIFFKIDELINILNNLDENIQNSFLSVSSYLILEKIFLELLASVKYRNTTLFFFVKTSSTICNASIFLSISFLKFPFQNRINLFLIDFLPPTVLSPCWRYFKDGQLSKKTSPPAPVTSIYIHQSWEETLTTPNFFKSSADNLLKTIVLPPAIVSTNAFEKEAHCRVEVEYCLGLKGLAFASTNSVREQYRRGLLEAIFSNCRTATDNFSSSHTSSWSENAK